MKDNPDEDLMEEINRHLEEAKSGAGVVDAKALATTLGQKFDHRTVEEIENKVNDGLRLRGMWATG
jgi:hypothetical protein